MPKYTYKAMTSSLLSIKGQTRANSVADLESKLTSQGLELIRAKKVGEDTDGKTKLTRQELITFCFSLEQIMQAGIPLLEGLGDLYDSLENGNLRNLIFELLQSIEGGNNLSQAMREHPSIFSNIFVILIEAGETSGTLAETCIELTKMQKWEDELVNSTRKLLMYPIISLVLVMGAIIFLLVWLVPQMAAFIKDMGGKLPTETKFLLALSSAIINYWYLIIIFPTLITVLTIILAKKNKKFQYVLHKMILKTPAIGPLYIKLIMARFAGTFALMFTAGISVLDTLKTCIGLTSNQVMKNAFFQSRENIQNGDSIVQGFAATGFFPPLVIRMLHTGEKTGDLSKSLQNITYFYDREVKDTIEKIQVMIGPTITVILASFIILILSSLLGPIFNLLSSIR